MKSHIIDLSYWMIFFLLNFWCIKWYCRFMWTVLIDVMNILVYILPYQVNFSGFSVLWIFFFLQDVEDTLTEKLLQKQNLQNLQNTVLLTRAQYAGAVNTFLTVGDTRNFWGQCRSILDCTECAVWSLIYTVHIFILDYKRTVSLSYNRTVFLANENIQFIYSVVKELRLGYSCSLFSEISLSNGV